MRIFHHIGGLDIEVLSASEYLFRNIEKYKNDEFFFNRALALFNLEYEKYFDNEIAVNEYALDVINNKKDYYEYCNKYRQEMEYRDSLYKYGIDNLVKSKSNKEYEKEKLLNEVKKIQNKKYSLIDYIRGTLKKDNNRVIVLIGDETKEGIINQIENELKEYENKIKDYEEEKLKLNELSEDLKILRKKIDEIESHKKVSVDFIDLTVNQDIEGDYPDTPIIALDRLIDNEDKYKKSIEKINNYREIAIEYMDYAKGQLTVETQTENILVEEECMEM